MTVREILNSRFDKNAFYQKVHENKSTFLECVNIALENQEPISWRATWVLEHSISKNDDRLIPFINDFLEVFPHRPEGHQRCILRVLRRMSLDEEQESRYFDHCMGTWENRGSIPSLRITALEEILKIAKKYPELKSEISFLLDPMYGEGLSPGIHRTFLRFKKDFLNS